VTLSEQLSEIELIWVTTFGEHRCIPLELQCKCHSLKLIRQGPKRKSEVFFFLFAPSIHSFKILD